MSYPIKYLSLQKSELEYEVLLRGGKSGSVQELRSQMVKLAIPAEDILESHLEPSERYQRQSGKVSNYDNNSKK